MKWNKNININRNKNERFLYAFLWTYLNIISIPYIYYNTNTQGKIKNNIFFKIDPWKNLGVIYFLGRHIQVNIKIKRKKERRNHHQEQPPGTTTKMTSTTTLKNITTLVRIKLKKCLWRRTLRSCFLKKRYYYRLDIGT